MTRQVQLYSITHTHSKVQGTSVPETKKMGGVEIRRRQISTPPILIG